MGLKRSPYLPGRGDGKVRERWGNSPTYLVRVCRAHSPILIPVNRQKPVETLPSLVRSVIKLLPVTDEIAAEEHVLKDSITQVFALKQNNISAANCCKIFIY